MNGKRPHEDDISSPQKRARKKLESPVSGNSSESDTESIHSYQGYKTELVNDTSDTSSSSGLQPYFDEYEVAEPDKVNLRYYFSDDSDTSDSVNSIILKQVDHKYKGFKVDSSDSMDNGLLGDTSEENSTSPTSNSDVDPGLPRNDYLDFEKCVLCQTNKKDISYPYCPTCFNWKKNLFPERPRRNRRNSKKNESDVANKKDNTSTLQNDENKNDSDETNKSSPSHALFDDSGVGSAETVQSEDTVDGPAQLSQASQTSQPSTSGSISASEASQPSASEISQPSTSGSISNSQNSQPSTSGSTSASASAPRIKGSQICSVCFLKPENGLFVHLKTAHRYGCYTCAKEIWYQNGGCPLCRRKVFKVTKLYI